MNNRVRKENPIFRSIWYKEKFISQFEEKRISVAGEQSCSRVWIACFLNFKSHITRQVSLFSQAMAKQLIQDKRKLPQSFVLCIFLAFSAFFFFFFLNRTTFRRTILSLSLSVCVYSPISHGWKSRGYASVNLLKHYILKKGMEKIWGIRGSIIPLELWMRRDQSYLK